MSHRREDYQKNKGLPADRSASTDGAWIKSKLWSAITIFAILMLILLIVALKRLL
ncbi:hypothetical protein [Mucilaginibacter sp. CSA2-8R]|uniref:hypothetical protein n=1 Tax=Mucilaginibacter sp. CSA2-8R TaxID=3141542 RepID=UPI00315CD66F